MKAWGDGKQVLYRGWKAARFNAGRAKKPPFFAVDRRILPLAAVRTLPVRTRPGRDALWFVLVHACLSGTGNRACPGWFVSC
jgi:hypothetical protein